MGMIPNPTPTTLAVLFLGISILVFLMFLPALFELKKRRDAGPRMILDDIPAIPQLELALKIPISNIEEDVHFDYVAVLKTVSIITILPNLES